MSLPYTQNMQVLILEKLRYSQQESLSNTFRGAELSVEKDSLLNDFVLRCEWAVASLKGKSIQRPADWWEALKDRWAPTWFKLRYPVKNTVIETTKICPHLSTSSQQDHLDFFMYDGINPERARRLLEEKKDSIRRHGVRSKEDADIASTMHPSEGCPYIGSAL